MVLDLRKLLEKCREQNNGQYASFVDLTAVSTTGLLLFWNDMDIPKMSTDADPAAREPEWPDQIKR